MNTSKSEAFDEERKGGEEIFSYLIR